MKLAVIFTGGTIGSQLQEDGYISSSKETNYYLLDQYKKQSGNDVSFEIHAPYRILSENLQAEHLLLLIREVNEILRKNHGSLQFSKKNSPEISSMDSVSEKSNSSNNHNINRLQGIIITHGTDSLAYTAAILQYVFADSPIPIVLVSSDYVLTDMRANGFLNFSYAIEFIRQIRIAAKENQIGNTHSAPQSDLPYSSSFGNGVFVSYCNRSGMPMIHRGTRLQNVITYSADVFSILDTWYAKFENDRFLLNVNYKIQNENRNSLFCNPTLLADTGSIVFLKAVPGLTYPTLTNRHKAVLFEGYHSGTIPVDERLKAFTAAADALQIPIFLTGLTESADHYETVKQYLQLGIRPLVNRSTISQYCKLWLGISNNIDLIRLMNTSAAEDWC